MGNHRFDGVPVILVATTHAEHHAVETEFTSRYAHDYEVHVVETCDELLDLTRELTIDNRGTALIAAEPILADGDGLGLLDQVHSINPTSRRIALLAPAVFALNLPSLRTASSEGRLDTWLAIPTAPRDEEFHSAIVEMLSDWGWSTNAVEVDGVQIVTEMKSPETARIVDYLQRMGLPYRRFLADSEVGRSIVAIAGPDARLPLVRMPSKRPVSSTAPDEVNPDEILSAP
ncbi:MAG: response regulator, partial [Actinomycetota bacterium]|nr:response regulator [Actinomycetota bacterium]